MDHRNSPDEGSTNYNPLLGHESEAQGGTAAPVQVHAESER